MEMGKIEDINMVALKNDFIITPSVITHLGYLLNVTAIPLWYYVINTMATLTMEIIFNRKSEASGDQ